MRLVLTSDLHVDHHPEVVPLVAERVRALGPDVLVVAGDVSSQLETLEAALARLAGHGAAAAVRPRQPRSVDAAGGAVEPRALRARDPGRLRARRRRRDRHGACRDRRRRLLRRHRLVRLSRCATARSTPPSRREDYERGAWGRLRWNDTARIVWPDDDGRPLDAPAICDAQVASLERQLADAGARPTVVVTHHLPFAGLVTSKGEPPWDFINGFMGSDRLGEAMCRAANVRAGVCGHTHFRKRVDVDGAGGRFAVETSPVGYPREYARMAGLTLAERVADRVTAIDLR